MAEPNRRIDQFPLAPAIEPGGFLAYRSVERGRTEKIPVEWVTPSATTGNFEWQPDPVTYAEGDVVTYGGSWWQAQQAVPVDIIPGTDEDYWLEIPKATSGFVLWAAGAYTEDNVYVLFLLDGYVQLFQLIDAARPYVSSNLLTEWAAGDWELMSERAYVAITKTGHGFSVGNALTYKNSGGFNWNKYTTGDSVFAIVRQVVNANVAIALMTGHRIKGLTGLTAGSIYYAQSDGSISTTPDGDPVYMAISTTEAILF